MADWDSRIDMLAQATTADQEQLRGRLFSETERLRIDAALDMRAAPKPAVP